jgi:hypothetical protein
MEGSMQGIVKDLASLASLATFAAMLCLWAEGFGHSVF